MVASIEKNDVDLSKLFYYGDKFVIKDRKGKAALTVYIRLVGDAELNRARVFALRSSADLRVRLKDNTSDINHALIPSSYDELDKDQLVDLIVAYSMQDITREVLRDTTVPIPKEPRSDASLEEQEKYQKLVDEFPENRNKILNDSIATRIKEYRVELVKKSKVELEKEYESSIIKNLCEQEMLTKFREMCAFFGTFKDKEYTKQLFSSFESFDNILPDIKDQIIKSYSSLEMTNEQLKK
jgi:hypothetical protein